MNIFEIFNSKAATKPRAKSSKNVVETIGPDKNDPWEKGWRAGFRHNESNPYPAGSNEAKQWDDGYAEARAQPNHYDESVESDMPDLEAVGEPVESMMDAERRMAAGDRIFAAHEMDEEPFEIFNVGDLRGYTYDQVLAVPQGVEETTSDPKFDKMLKGITGKKAVAKQQKTDTKQQARDAFGSMFGGTSADLLKNLKIREQGVEENSGETPQQQKVRTAISNGLAKSSQMGKSEYQSQPTKRTYFDNAGYASDKLTGIDSIDPDGTVVISMGDTRAGVWVKKLATLGGMPGVKTREAQPKKGVAEGSVSGYKEIEFVCVNPKFPEATDPKLQKQMYLGLQKIPGVIPLLQNWSDMSEGQTSLTAIYKDRESRQQILALAKRLGVSIDLEQPVSHDYVDRAVRGEHEGQQGVAEGKLVESAVFLNPNTVVVGQAHGQPLELSPDTLKKIQAIAAKHGAYYEGNGTDRSYTKGQIDRYVGSWDDEVAKTASPNDPKWLYVLFANVDENNRVQRVGVDPKDTIFNQLLATAKDNSFQGIGYTSQALQKFLQMSSEGKYDFVKMSQQPATQENLTRFLKAGEALMWPSNWEQYPNKAGKIAKAATVDVRDQYLATRKAGVYVTGSGHLKAVQNITDKQGVAEKQLDELSVHKMLKYSNAAEKDRDALNQKWDNRTASEKEKERVLHHEKGEQRAADKIKQKTGKLPVQIGKLDRLKHAITREGVAEGSYKDTSGTFVDRIVGEIMNYRSLNDTNPKFANLSSAVKSKLKSLGKDRASQIYQQALKQAAGLSGRSSVTEAERNEMDTPAVQAALKNMAARHNKEQWSKEQLAALGRRLAAQDKKSVKEDATDLNVGDDVIITGNVKFNGTTGMIVAFGRDKRFVVVNLYNHGKHSFHSSDVSANEYADSDAEEADMYDRDPDARDWASQQGGMEEDQWHGDNNAWSDGKGQWSDGRGQWSESVDRDVTEYLSEMKSAGYDIK